MEKWFLQCKTLVIRKITVLEFVQEGETYYAMYAHLSHIGVKEKEEIKEGAILGKTGISGNASNLGEIDRHLHFEIRTIPLTGKGLANRLDPMPFFDAFKTEEPASLGGGRGKEKGAKML